MLVNNKDLPLINVNDSEITPDFSNGDEPIEAPKMNIVSPKLTDETLEVLPKTDGLEPRIVWWKNMTVEIFMFLYMFASTLELTANGNLFMDRVCLVNMNISEEICGNLTSHQDTLNRVQAQSNNMTLYVTLIAILPGVVYAMFAGTWSDKYGRKPLIFSALIGNIIHDIAYLLFVYFDHLPVEYGLITYVPISLTGGYIVVIGMVYSMTSDKSGLTKRTLKYAILEAFIFLALPVAGVVAGQIYKYYGYLPVFGLALIFHLLALVILIFVLTDNCLAPTEKPILTKLADFFTLDAVKDNFRTCWKKRENYGRAQILLLMPSGFCILLNSISLSGLSYYYANKIYGWDLPKYTTISTSFSIATMFVMIIAIPLTTILMKLSDATLGLIGSTSMAAQNIAKAFSYQPWIFYLSYVFGLLSGMAPMSFRSKLSKTVQANESGKVFAVLAIFESLAPVGGNLMFTQIYNYSLETFPGLVFLFGSFLLILPIVVFGWLMRFPSTSNCERLEGDVPSQSNVGAG